MMRSLDPTLLLLWLAALSVGIVMVASASAPLAGHAATLGPLLARHAVYVTGGLVLCGVCVALPLSFWESMHRPILLVAVALAVVVLIPGVGHLVNGARRWLALGPVSIQAAEFGKFAMVVYLAGYVARHERVMGEIRTLVPPGIALSALALLYLAEPDFGSVVVLVLLCGGVLFVAGARPIHFAALALLAVAVLAALAVLQPYRMQRLVSFLDPWSVAYGSGYQLTQALIAFGRGEWFGLGLGAGIQKLFYLPEAHNDFIFAVIAEELGLAGAVAVLLLLLALVYRLLGIARAASLEGRTFGACVAYGAAFVIGIQTLINVGVNTGTLPTKGLTLPFVSYGGNSLLTCCGLMGLAMRVALERSRSGR
jgi:cell division protein FtsW